jgi:hypothetical protein
VAGTSEGANNKKINDRAVEIRETKTKKVVEGKEMRSTLGEVKRRTKKRVKAVPKPLASDSEADYTQASRVRRASHKKGEE